MNKENDISHKYKKDFIKLSANVDFVDYVVSFLDSKCPIKKSPATKFSNRDYFLAVLDVFEHYSFWSSYNGPLKWKTVHKYYRKWVSDGIFEEIHSYCLSSYLKNNKTNKLKYQSIDSCSIVNKQGVELIGVSKNKGPKKTIKVSVICDSYGAPLGVHLLNGATNDSISIKETLNNIPIDLETSKYSKINRHKQNFLADAGYCSKNNRSYLRKIGYRTLIWKNKRNTKDKKKITKFNKNEQKTYKKRSIIESMFSWLKNIPKINCLYEKTSSSFKGILLLGACYLITNKT